MSAINSCRALIQQGPRKGNLCGKYTDTEYCVKHIRQTVVDKAKLESIKYCDISRGCFTVLEEHQSKCSHCLQKARIRDRKREDKKRQDKSLCLDCGNTLTTANRAIGKHDKELRRCIQCYEKLLKVESKRERPERNYKAEGFQNKHVVWNHYVKGAKKRGLNFTISKIKFNELIILPCFYCDYTAIGEVNGIDRIDNNKGYVDDNIITCCQSCNIMKGTQHPLEFIDKLNAINSYKVYATPILIGLTDKWTSTYLSKTIPNYKQYSKSATSRNLLFTITEDEFNSIVSKQCYLCGINNSDKNKNGIDRFDNNKGYIFENCRPCCGHCNILKKDLSYEKIIHIANKISSKYSELVGYFSGFDIKIRESKVEPRIKIVEPIGMDIEIREYKPLNEIIVPKHDIPIDVKELLEKPKIKTVKQWKVKQIYNAIKNNKEKDYKEYCEMSNEIIDKAEWEINWNIFINTVKEKPADAILIIKQFVDNLRRIRHNILCYKSKHKQVQIPSIV